MSLWDGCDRKVPPGVILHDEIRRLAIEAKVQHLDNMGMLQVRNQCALRARNCSCVFGVSSAHAGL